MRALSIWFAAGVVGGLLNGLFVWTTGKSGLNRALGLAINPPWTKDFLYNKLVWGGVWGLLFYAVAGARGVGGLAAFFISLAPTAVQLFYVFPKAQKGLAGAALGKLTWLYVVAANAVWAFGALWWFNMAR